MLHTAPRCVSKSFFICAKLESFIEFTIPRVNQNPVMQKVCPNGLHPLVHLAKDVLCILLICLVHLILNVPVSNFTVMLGRGHRFLGITTYQHFCYFCCTFNYSFQQFLESSEKPALQRKLKWDKTDKTRYQTMVTTKLMEVRNAGPCTLDIHVRQINDALVKAAEEVRPKTVTWHRKARLNMWTQEIKEALSSKKKAFWE